MADINNDHVILRNTPLLGHVTYLSLNNVTCYKLSKFHSHSFNILKVTKVSVAGPRTPKKARSEFGKIG